MQIPSVARAHCQQRRTTSYAAEPGMTAAAATPDETVRLQLWNCLCRLDLDLSTHFHIAAVTVGRGFTLFLKEKKKKKTA